jgi:Tfp pilus assembly protein PilE
MGPTPLQFRIADIEATQTVNGQLASLKVITYEELVQEEHNRQVAAAILVGVAAGANAYSASQAGRYNSSSTVYTPQGAYQVNTVGYSPTANAIAQANASAQNDAMISATIEQGQQNLANLERAVIKDDTIMPREWYGGTLHLQPLASSGSNDAPKTYSITLLVGQDRHMIDIVQTPVR